MKLYSDKITENALYNAARDARQLDSQDIHIEDARQFKARKSINRYGLEFYGYSYTGKQASGHRPVGSYPLDGTPRAASWDAWGWLITRLFKIDPEAWVGQYKGIHDFIRQCEQTLSYRRDATGSFLQLARNVACGIDGRREHWAADGISVHQGKRATCPDCWMITG